MHRSIADISLSNATAQGQLKQAAFTSVGPVYTTHSRSLQNTELLRGTAPHCNHPPTPMTPPRTWCWLKIDKFNVAVHDRQRALGWQDLAQTGSMRFRMRMKTCCM